MKQEIKEEHIRQSKVTRGLGASIHWSLFYSWFASQCGTDGSTNGLSMSERATFTRQRHRSRRSTPQRRRSADRIFPCRRYFWPVQTSCLVPETALVQLPSRTWTPAAKHKRVKGVVMSTSVCLCLCGCPRAYLRNYTCNLRHIFYVGCLCQLRPWFGSAMTALRSVLDLSGWLGFNSPRRHSWPTEEK